MRLLKFMSYRLRPVALFIFIALFQLNAFADQRISGSALIEACRLYVLEKTGLTDEALVLDIKYPITAQDVPDGIISFQISGAVDLASRGNLPLTATVLVNNEAVQTIYPILNFDIKVLAYMAKRWIKKGEYLTLDNVAETQINKSNLPSNPLQNVYEFEGKIAKFALPEGKIINGSVIDEPSLVTRNQPVLIMVNAGNIKIQAKGIAMHSGKRGETIQVRNFDSRKIIYAKIIGQDTVAMEVW